MSRFIRLILLLLLPAAVYPADVYVPDELEEWRTWVLDGKEYRDCPFYFNTGASARSDFLCRWPGLLSIEVGADSGRFSQRWIVAADDAWLPLPGDASHWPDRVTINGSAAAVIERNGLPSIKVGPGEYTLTGRFAWDSRPGVLRVPPQSGLIALTVDGERIDRPEISRNSLFLGEREAETASEERDSVSVSIYRLVADAVPTRLATRFRIEVSGSVREELFGPVLPEGFVPVAINSVLPVRLEPDGKLRVQVRPGRWDVSLVARAPGVINELSHRGGGDKLPDSEIWSYQSDDRLRVTSADGLPPVDPQRVQVPGEWQALPAFRIAAGEVLTITERSRGIASAENDLTLNRAMWLDFSGDGFVVRDSVGGTMRTDWRLDMRTPFALKSASEDDESLLITRGDEPGETGIEVRRPDVNVAAIGRSESRSAMPVTGWTSRFASVSTVLYLPPGNKLVAAPGADAARGSWAGQWQLLDFFLVLIITISAWKLFGRGAGIIALLALVLSYNEVGSPAWLWLNLLVAVALLRVAPEGRLRKTVQSYLAASAVFLALALVPFIGDQLRIAIYPQLEPQYQSYSPMPAAERPMEADMLEAEPAPKTRRESTLGMTSADVPSMTPSVEEIVTTGAKLGSTNYARYAPNAIVQAGPGIPSWQWNAYRLDWNGPVDAGQSLRLIVLPRWAVTLLRFAQVGVLLLFAAVFAAEILRRSIRLPGGMTLGRGVSTVLLAGCLGLGMFASPPADAQTPAPEILRELEARLLRPPECVPRCAEIAAARVEVRNDVVDMQLTINALQDIAMPLPGAAGGWRPDAISVDGAGAAQVRRSGNGSLWLRVSPGRHRVSLRGAAAGVDSLEIPFPAPPRVIEVVAEGWFVAGVQDRRLESGSLQLSRLQAEEGGDGTPRWESSRFPPFVVISRSIELGLDWRVTTTVRRIAPVAGALSLELPLIDGETVVTENLDVEDGKLRLTMNPQQSAASWQSNLPRTSPLTLTAADGKPWTEVWYVGVGTVWHASFSGVPESVSGSQDGSVRTAEFHPRGGESLTIDALRPEAAAGATLAFDAVTLGFEQGARTASGTLDLSYRSTRGAQHVIRLPETAEVTRVLIDHAEEPLRAEGGELTVPILPGEHQVSVSWREDRAAGWRTATPSVDIGAAASNITLKMGLPDNRWLLATSGPKLGPAVLYWSEMAILVLFALILGRISWTPLRTWHWLLLGLGFSTFNWPVMALVIAWLLGVGARDRWRKELSWWRYNLVQSGIIALTVIALIAILVSLPQGLLGTPDMHVAGNNSSGNSLSWFADRSESAVPSASAFTVPMWIYKALILAWALWLSFALLRWLPWTWSCFAKDGFFRSRQRDQLDAQGGGASE